MFIGNTFETNIFFSRCFVKKKKKCQFSRNALVKINNCTICTRLTTTILLRHKVKMFFGKIYPYVGKSCNLLGKARFKKVTYSFEQDKITYNYFSYTARNIK